jgi:hypothetical protein
MTREDKENKMPDMTREDERRKMPDMTRSCQLTGLEAGRKGET